MKYFLTVFFIIPYLAFGQIRDDDFLKKLLLGAELKSKNVVENFKQHDFSALFTITPNEFIYGIIGEEHQRIRIKIIRVNKCPENPEEYDIVGKSIVKETICDFKGKIILKEIKEVKELIFGIDNEYKNKGIKSQGVLIAEYIFEENMEQKHSGVFTGLFYSKWYLNAENKVVYNNIQKMSDSYLNNAFIGYWENYEKSMKKVCNWADYRVPNANNDFDIGTAELNVSEKYIGNGWIDISLRDQAPNDAIKRKKKKTKLKEWWE